MFDELYVNTDRGLFEIFKSGKGEPLVYTHLYSEFNEYGDYLSQLLSEYFTVYIVNLRGAGKSDEMTDLYTYSMKDTINDLESIKEELNLKTWTMAGHSTGGFLALYYALLFPNSLKQIIAGGISASGDYMNNSKSIYNESNPNNKRLMEIFKKFEDPNISVEDKKELNKDWVMMSLNRKSAYFEMINIKQSGKVLLDRLNYFSEELTNYDISTQLKNTDTLAYIYIVVSMMPNVHLNTVKK